VLKANPGEHCAYRCRGGATAGAGKALGGKRGGPNHFCRPSVPWGRVLFSGAEIGGGTAGLPRWNCKWIFIYSGSWDEQGLSGSAAACWAAPRGTN